MHVQTHILSGWCIGNIFPITAKQRFACMIAASIADVDGLSIIFGQNAYWNWHHTVGHNLFFGLIVSAAGTFITSDDKVKRLGLLILYLALFHLHLWLDYWGSGPDWHIRYLWPMHSAVWINPRAWPFYSWQNLTAAAVLMAWSVGIWRWQRRTPLEYLMPRLDRELVEIFAKRGLSGGRA